MPYIAPYSSAIYRTDNGKMSDIVSAFDFIPLSLQAAIRAGTSTTDVSSYLTAMHAAVSAGVTFLFPAGQYNIGAGSTVMTGRVIYAVGATFTGGGSITGALFPVSSTGISTLAGGGLGDSQAAATAGQVPVAGGGGSPFVPTTITPAIISNLFDNPSASIGLTANNGVAATAMRSDATPALSQSISPTWTATHTFSSIIMATAPTLSHTSIAQGVANLYSFGLTSNAANSATGQHSLDINFTCTPGSFAPVCVTGYFAVEGQSGSGEVFAVNPVINLLAGFTSAAQNEFDVNNGGTDRGTTNGPSGLSNPIYGLTVNGIGNKITSAYMVNLTAYRGYTVAAGSTTHCDFCSYGSPAVAFDAWGAYGTALLKLNSGGTADYIIDLRTAGGYNHIYGDASRTIDIGGVFTGLWAFNSSSLNIKGSSTGVTAIASANASATDYVLTLPAVTGTVITTAGGQSIAGLTVTSTFAAATVTASGTFHSTNTTDSTSPTSASSIYIDGGLSVAKTIFAAAIGVNAGAANAYFSQTTTSAAVDNAVLFSDGTTSAYFGFLPGGGGTAGDWTWYSGAIRMTLSKLGLLTLPNIGSDATHTDSTICQDTTTHALYSGSGALGVCLGTSGVQFKTAFTPMKAGLNEIMKIDMMNYRYRSGHGDGGTRMQYGTTAQNVAAVLPDLVGLNNNGEIINYDWGALLFVGIHAIQQLKADSDNLRYEFEQFKQRDSR